MGNPLDPKITDGELVGTEVEKLCRRCGDLGSREIEIILRRTKGDIS